VIKLNNVVNALVPNAEFVGDATNIVDWHDIRPQPTESEIQAKIAELEAAEPLRQLRLERTRRLAQSDWMANSDVTMTEAWRVYRQALRDITTQTPSLDVDGNLTGITWPTTPTD